VNSIYFSTILWAGALAAGETSDHAKEPALDTRYLREHAETRGFMLGRPTRAKPTPDGKAVLFLRSEPRVPTLRLFEFDVATAETRELLSPEQILKGADESLSAEEKARRERQRVNLGGFTDFQLSENGKRILLSLSGKLYLVERNDGKVSELTTGAGTLLDPKFSPDGRSIAYVLDHDLHVLDLDTSRELRLTTGGSATKTHGLAEFVAQEEMARASGYWWSPDSRFIAFEEADASGVEVWYVADPAKPDQPAGQSFYPRPGKANVSVRLGIVPAAGGETVWVEWDGRRYPYLAQVNWPEHGPLTLTVQTREQHELVLLRADPSTGKTKRLATERDDAWVNLHQDVPRWLGDGCGFLWTSESEDGPRLELRDANGELQRIVVPASEGYMGLIDLDDGAGQVIYAASSDPTQRQLYRVALERGEPVPLTRESGVHTAVFAKDHSLYVQQSSLARSMPTARIFRGDGELIGELPSVAADPPFVPQDELLKVGDGDGFYAALVRPQDFDAKKRYSVILHVYGGPTHRIVEAAMQTRLLDQWLADQGFIVASLDNRGTPGRGRAWERAVYRHFGSVPLDDQVAGLNALCERFGELDQERVGIYGWSFGGYLSALAVLRRPDVFHAAVAGAPVVDWLDYDTHYTERYLGLPDDSSAAYHEASLLTYAAELKRPLLLVHGTADDNVYFRHTLKLTDALFREGKEFELLPLAGLTHMVPDPVVMQRLYGRIAGHFRRHLGQPR
jgi:dipeptidyl-peptidase-4